MKLVGCGELREDESGALPLLRLANQTDSLLSGFQKVRPVGPQ